MRIRFELADSDKLAVATKGTATIVFACPNYEERSTAFLQNFVDSCRRHSGDTARVQTYLLWPQGTSTRVDLLEQLKVFHMQRLSDSLKSVSVTRRVIPYPNDYNEKKVIEVFREAAEQYQGEPLSFIVDISCMPRRVLVSACEAIRAILTVPERQLSVFFTYSSPARYTALRYAQNVGELNGYFSGKAIHDYASDHVAALVFPGLQGYEGKSLYDGVRSHISSTIAAFVAVGGYDYHTALATMRANQFLMEQKHVDIVYYFSLIDGIDKLQRRLQAEIPHMSGSDRRLILAAPFGPKVFTLACYFMLSSLKDDYPRCNVEIAHVSGFQYLSVYSLGFSHFVTLRLLSEG